MQSDGNNLNIYSGSKNTEGGVTFASQSTVNNIPNLSYNTTRGRVSGISISPSGGVAQVTPWVDKEGNITGMTTKTTATPSASAGATITEGSSISSSGFTDINGDGLVDYFDGSSFRLGTGNNMLSYSGYNGVSVISDTTSQSFGMNANLGVGVGSGQCLSVALFSLNAAVGVTYGSSSSVVNKRLMDINGDGLQDIVSMERGSTTIKVKYNKGNSFTDYQIVDIPSWGYTITNNKDAFWDIRLSQRYINGKTALDNVI